jgi:hypothetical protein
MKVLSLIPDALAKVPLFTGIEKVLHRDPRSTNFTSTISRFHKVCRRKYILQQNEPPFKRKRLRHGKKKQTGLSLAVRKTIPLTVRFDTKEPRTK